MRLPRSRAALAACLSVCACAASAPGQTLTKQLVASGLSKPLFVTHAPGDFSRIFIVEQGGRVKIVQNGTLLATPFLDLSTFPGFNSSYLEYGLLGLAFHPDYATNGYFFVYHTVGPATTPQNPFIARYRVSAGNPNLADTASRQQVWTMAYTLTQHRAGWMEFGQDGYLYVTTGDGGEGDPQNNASNLNHLGGKVLRLDVDGPDNIIGNADDDAFPADAALLYSIPPTNPFVSTPNTRGEIWAYGLRNPWRADLDNLTGDLWIADVGQTMREEVNFVPGTSTGGEFYGWKCWEGTLPYGACGVAQAPIVPIHDYPRTVGTSITGGFVYRGCAIPSLQGQYIFGDWGGKVWRLQRNLSGPPTVTEITAQVGVGGTLSSFGEDAYGEVYLCKWSSTANADTVHKIVPTALIGPDCNGNGKNDACDILDGTATDANNNGIPDSCDTPDCPADFNGQNGVTVQDIYDFLSQWNAQNPAADFNGQNGVTVQDIYDFLSAWNTDCP